VNHEAISVDIRVNTNINYVWIYNTYERQNFGHFHLSEDSTRNVAAQTPRIPNGESVWTFDSNFPGFTSIQPFHTFDFGKGDKIAIFKTMTSFVKACDKTIFILCIK
jgi:hypothetical protein